MRIHYRNLRGSGGSGAVRFLLTGSWKETEEIMTPKGDSGVRIAGRENFRG